MSQNKIPLLSVIIPVYNAERYLAQCLTSVLRAGWPNIEVLCVDDGSTDASAALIEDAAAKDGRIRPFRQSNRSAGAARNLGLQHAKGTYIHFLDADDTVCAGTYENAIRRLEEAQADVYIFQYLLRDDDTGSEKKCPCLLNGRERVTEFRKEPAFFIYNMVAPWNKLYRRDWIEANHLRFDEIHSGNDRGFYFRVLAASQKIALSMAYGVSYRVKHAGSLTGDGRYRHLDSLLYAWDTSEQAMADEAPPIRAMLLDCIVTDILSVLCQAPAEKRGALLVQLKDRFSQLDLSLMDQLPMPYTWRNDAQLIAEGTHPGAFSRGMADRLRHWLAMYRVWGLRGCIIKALF